MIWKISTIIFLVLILLLGGISTYLYSNPRTEIQTIVNQIPIYTSNKLPIDFEYENIEKVQKNQINVDQLHITGWIPDWDIVDGLNSISIRSDVFDSISPVWFFINEDGTLKKTPQTNGANQIQFFKDRNIDLVPSIQEFSSANLSKVLNDQNRMNTLISEIISETVTNNYAGIDLDIEEIMLKDKKLFFTFLESLSSEFKKINKKLIFTALPKWSELLFFTPFPQTMRVQDYKRIADLVDEFRLMTYEYSGPRSLKAGPVQPLEWQEQVIQYTISKGVPREKIVLGVATYSYDWSERDMLESIDLKNPAPPSGNLEAGVSLSNTSITKIKDNYEYTEEFNESWGEMVLRYEYQEKNRVVVYPNSRSIELRKQLAADYGIKGVAYWRLGDDQGLEL